MVLDHFGTHVRPDGLVAVSDKIVEMYFPAVELAEDRARQLERFGYTLDELPARDRPASAFQQFNGTIARALAEADAEARGLDVVGITKAGMAALSTAKIKINAALHSGNIY